MNPQEYMLSIESRGDDLDQVHRQVANLEVLLTDSDVVRVVGRARVSTEPSDVAAEKAEPVTLTAILLALVTSGTVPALSARVRDVTVAIIDAINASRSDWRKAKVAYKIAGPGREPFEFEFSDELTDKQTERVLLGERQELVYLPLGDSRFDDDVVLGQSLLSFQSSLDPFHLLGGDLNAVGMLGARTFDDWVSAPPGHSQSALQNHLQAVQDRTVPFLLQG